MPESLEEPKFEIIQKYEGFEVRKYVDTIQAQVASPISEEVSSSNHFREIANYIFGNNDKTQNISMTAPVHTWKQNKESLMAFTMPSKFNLENLPKPNNNRIKILNVKGEIAAVLKFSWFSGIARAKKLTQKLQNLIKAEGITLDLAIELADSDVKEGWHQCAEEYRAACFKSLGRFSDFVGNKRNLRTLGDDDMEAFSHELLKIRKTNKKGESKQLTFRTMNQMLIQIGKVFNLAFRRGYIDKPIEYIKEKTLKIVDYKSSKYKFIKARNIAI